MPKYLRIAVTALSLTACVLVFALWVRSFHYKDVLGGVIFAHVFAFESAEGHVAFMSYYLNPAFTASPWGVTSYYRETRGFGVRMNPRIVVKDWCLLLLFGALSAIPWIHRIKWDAKPHRFSLRDLFIIMTLTAIGLALIIYALK